MFSLSVLTMVFTETFAQPLKVMFFGDSVISGVHDNEYDICPFRYEFLRRVELLNHEVQIVGTNADPEGTCQKIGEGLDGHNNGYQNSATGGLLDYIMADIQYLHNPVDYIFTSLGAKDCLEFVEGRDYQIISQSIRRIMGRLLSINEKAKLVHVPILLPESAGTVAVKCMNIVNGKLREIYADNLNHSSIAVLKLAEEKLSKDSFYIVGASGKQSVTPKAVVPPSVTQPAVVPNTGTSPAVVVTPPAVTPTTVVRPQASPVVVTPSVLPAAPVAIPQTPGSTVVTPNFVPNTPVVTPSVVQPAPVGTPVVVQPVPVVQPQTSPVTVTTPVTAPAQTSPAVGGTPSIVQPATTVEVPTVKPPNSFPSNTGTSAGVQPVTGGDNTRRIVNPLMYLPKEDLVKEIAGLLIKTVDWGFRAQTLQPTPKVTKEPEYYGYDWCKKNYEDSVCFEYYYGYVWCTENYGEDACYDYYYGSLGNWGPDENYKYCLNWYDEEYCQFAYLDGKPETWDWLSFGYHDCLKNKTTQTCFDLYYGYAWCLSEKKDVDCYAKYYGADDWEWTPEASFKWCLNFHPPKNCSDTYLLNSTRAGYAGDGSGNMVLALLVAVLVFGGSLWLTRKKLNCFKSRKYKKLDTRQSGEDEVELL